MHLGGKASGWGSEAPPTRMELQVQQEETGGRGVPVPTPQVRGAWRPVMTLRGHGKWLAQPRWREKARRLQQGAPFF